MSRRQRLRSTALGRQEARRTVRRRSSAAGTLPPPPAAPGAAPAAHRFPGGIVLPQLGELGAQLIHLGPHLISPHPFVGQGALGLVCPRLGSITPGPGVGRLGECLIARNHRIPIEWAEKGVRKEDYILPWQRRMVRTDTYATEL